MIQFYNPFEPENAAHKNIFFISFLAALKEL